MTDISYGEVSLRPAWVAFGHRVAAAAGASTALTALLVDAPLLVACRRGALAWFAIVVATRACAWLLARVTPQAEPEEPEANRVESAETNR